MRCVGLGTFPSDGGRPTGRFQVALQGHLAWRAPALQQYKSCRLTHHSPSVCFQLPSSYKSHLSWSALQNHDSSSSLLSPRPFPSTTTTILQSIDFFCDSPSQPPLKHHPTLSVPYPPSLTFTWNPNSDLTLLRLQYS